ncbi:MAG: hypothetical protein LBO69_05575 [Ignavibacteria bacterium]|jgi:hypothetical protein|nr:hypothetical protein [Ignavibacteria bacterium]
MKNNLQLGNFDKFNKRSSSLSDDTNWLEVLEKHGQRALPCAFASAPLECALKEVGVQFCDELPEEYREACKAVSATISNEIKPNESQVKAVESIEKARIEQAMKDAEGILQQFGNIPCKELTDEQRSELSARLEKARETFKNLQMEDALNGVLNKFKCDLELHCEMAPNPIVEELTKNNIPIPVGLPPTVSVCKYEPRVNNLLQWGVPAGVGGATGAGLWFATRKATLGLIGGVIGFGLTKYLIAKNE